MVARCAEVGARLTALGEPDECSAGWLVDGVGCAAVLSWLADRGFVYRTKRGRRWSTCKRGKRLETVLEVVKADVEARRRELERSASFFSCVTCEGGVGSEP